LAKELSHDEIRERDIRDMGPDLGSVYNALTNEITWLHAKWIQYRQLFACSPERIAILNETAGHFFRVIQDSLFEDVVLHLARLADSPKSLGRDNLCLQRLSSLVIDPHLAGELRRLIEAAISACEKLRIWRNRRLAHRDLSLALATSSDPLPGISRADVEAALAAVRAVVLRLESHYWNSETQYAQFVSSGGDANSLITFLQSGIQARKLQFQRLREGRSLPGDLEIEDPV